jgi:hypothetical protein
MTMQPGSDMDRQMSMGAGATANVMIGSHVFTSDGDDLGTVKELWGGYFKVDAPMKPDFWLSTSHVGTATADRIHMSFTKDQLGDFKTESPDERRDRHAA